MSAFCTFNDIVEPKVQEVLQVLCGTESSGPLKLARRTSSVSQNLLGLRLNHWCQAWRNALDPSESEQASAAERQPQLKFDLERARLCLNLLNKICETGNRLQAAVSKRQWVGSEPKPHPTEPGDTSKDSNEPLHNGQPRDYKPSESLLNQTVPQHHQNEPGPLTRELVLELDQLTRGVPPPEAYLSEEYKISIQNLEDADIIETLRKASGGGVDRILYGTLQSHKQVAPADDAQQFQQSGHIYEDFKLKRTNFTVGNSLPSESIGLGRRLPTGAPHTYKHFDCEDSEAYIGDCHVASVQFNRHATAGGGTNRQSTPTSSSDPACHSGAAGHSNLTGSKD